MTNPRLATTLRSRRTLLAGTALLLLIGAGAWLLSGGASDDAPAPWERLPEQASPRREGVAVVYDVSESVPLALQRDFTDAIGDANGAVVGILCTGKVATDRWSAEGAVPNFHEAEKLAVILRIGAPAATPPFFPEVTPVGAVARDQCQAIGSRLPAEGFKHQLSYIELGKAEAAGLLRQMDVTDRYMIVVSDFVEGQAKRPNVEWDRAVDRYLTTYVEETVFSAHWKRNSRLKVRVIKLKDR